MRKKYDDSMAILDYINVNAVLDLETSTKDDDGINGLHRRMLDYQLQFIAETAHQKLSSYGYEVDWQNLIDEHNDLDPNKLPDINTNEELEAYEALNAIYYACKTGYWCKQDDAVNACLSLAVSIRALFGTELSAASLNSKRGANQVKSGKKKAGTKHDIPENQKSREHVVELRQKKDVDSKARAAELLFNEYAREYGESKARHILGGMPASIRQW